MHKGIFKLSCLPFGLKLAPSLFQQIIDIMLAGMEYAITYLDDILIKSENKDQHKTHIRAEFQRIEECSVKLGAKKCEFFMKKIKYLGQTIDSDGRKPDPERAEAIKNMPVPDNVAKLLVFLGLVSSSSSYHAISMDIPDPLTQPLPIVYCFRHVFRVTSCIGTELLYVGVSWLSCLCSSLWWGPQEYIIYECVPHVWSV